MARSAEGASARRSTRAAALITERRVTAAGDGDYAVNTTQSIFLNNGRQGGNVLPAHSVPSRSGTA